MHCFFLGSHLVSSTHFLRRLLSIPPASEHTSHRECCGRCFVQFHYVCQWALHSHWGFAQFSTDPFELIFDFALLCVIASLRNGHSSDWDLTLYVCRHGLKQNQILLLRFRGRVLLPKAVCVDGLRSTVPTSARFVLSRRSRVSSHKHPCGRCNKDQFLVLALHRLDKTFALEVRATHVVPVSFFFFFACCHQVSLQAQLDFSLGLVALAVTYRHVGRLWCARTRMATARSSV